MANELLKVTMFVIMFHGLVFLAMDAGHLTAETGQNKHKSFVEQFLSGQFSDTVDIGQDTGIISGTVRLASQVVDFIGFMTGIAVSPFLLLAQSPLPSEFKLLFTSLLGFLEIGAIAYFVRGIS